MTKKVGLSLLILTTTAFLLLGATQLSSDPTSASAGQIEGSTGTGSRETHPNQTLNPALYQVCSCESDGKADGTPHQFNPDGTVVRGKINPHDIGMCQINSDFHEAAATKMGLDIYTEAGNIAYANYLYKTQGLTPWNWSKSCWAKPATLSTSTPTYPQAN